MDCPPKYSGLIEKFFTSLESFPWFHSVGKDLDINTQSRIDSYLDSINREQLSVCSIEKWSDVRSATRNREWDRDILTSQMRTRENISREHDIGSDLDIRSDFLEACITQIAKSSDRASKLAYGACQDVWLSKAASGAAAESAYEALLSIFEIDSSTKPAKLKFDLFLKGRWPLSITTKEFFIF